MSCGRSSGPPPRQAAFRDVSSSSGRTSSSLVRLQARHVMLPRVDVVSLSTDEDPDENLAILGSRGHSRFPLGDPDLDSAARHGPRPGRDRGAGEGRPDRLQEAGPAASHRARPAAPRPTDPGPPAAEDDLRPGGRRARDVGGLAFLEDALEEIVGPIADEFDTRRSGSSGSTTRPSRWRERCPSRGRRRARRRPGQGETTRSEDTSCRPSAISPTKASRPRCLSTG